MKQLKFDFMKNYWEEVTFILPGYKDGFYTTKVYYYSHGE
jgi:hypothetical protein